MLDRIVGGVGSLLKNGLGSDIKNAIDELHLSPEEKMAHELKIMDRVNARAAQVASEVMAQFESVTRIIEAEMKSGDNYTRRARPSMVYWGMFLLSANHFYNMWMNTTRIDWAYLEVPDTVTTAWSGVVGVWVVGRTVEKARAGSLPKPAQSIADRVMGK